MNLTRPATIHDSRYREIIEFLIESRKRLGVHQAEIAEAMGWTQPYISKIERFERRLDVLELTDYVNAIARGNREISRPIIEKIFGLSASVRDT